MLITFLICNNFIAVLPCTKNFNSIFNYEKINYFMKETILPFPVFV